MGYLISIAYCLFFHCKDPKLLLNDSFHNVILLCSCLKVIRLVHCLDCRLISSFYTGIEAIHGSSQIFVEICNNYSKRVNIIHQFSLYNGESGVIAFS